MTTITTRRGRMPAWAVLLLVLIVAASAAVGGIALGKFLGAGEERAVQVARSVKGEEQVILLTAGLTDIREESSNQDFFGLFDIPFSDRTVFLRYDFDAKFGIEGKEVDIAPTDDKSYTITIPPFIFLGYDDAVFDVATESNGILSWTTPQIDRLQAVEEILTEEALAEHVEGFRPLLEQQAVTFYTRIVSSIDPEATLKFEFSR